MMTQVSRPSTGSTLAYAEPAQQPVFPLRWALNALLIFAIATIAERASIWAMLFSIFSRRGGFGLGLRDVVDYVLPPLTAAALLWVVLRQRRCATPTLTRSLVVLCAIQVALAICSIAYWSATVLPRVWTANRGGGVDAIVWEMELIHLRLLPIAWPLMIVWFARRSLPTPRIAAAALTCWSMATWICAALATAALWNQRGTRALSPDRYGYTVAPAWTCMLIPVVAVAVIFWVGAMPVRLRPLACLLAWLPWFAASLMRAWYDERMVSVRDGRFAGLAHVANLSGIIAEAIADLILWQIAPVALLLFLARHPPHQVD
jgi:hypothetical protein